MSSRFSQSDDCVSLSTHEYSDVGSHRRRDSEVVSTSYGNATTTTSMVYLPQNVVLCGLTHDEAFEASECGLVSKWRVKDRVRFHCLVFGS